MDPHSASSLPGVSDSISDSDPAIEATAADAPVLDASGVDTPAMNQPATSMLTDNPYVYVIRAYDPHATEPHDADPSATAPPTGRRGSFVEESFSVASSEASVDCMAIEMSKDVVKVSGKMLQRCNAVAGDAARAAKNWHREKRENRHN